ncbi:MAG: hypothetical protein A2Y24_03720 [Clostridiales bacterium GWE2_32_10]|nr:MAG: hypothetical protein A2Y24_03720 [Clostridiales bacterium GWE2_32_10]
MKKMLDKIMGAMGMVEYEDEEFDTNESKHADQKKEPINFGYSSSMNNDESSIKTFATNNSKIVNIHNNVQMRMVVVSPHSYEEAREVCDYIKARKPVVVNLESMDHQIAQRVMDFLSGSCYSLNGDIRRVTKNIFVLAPDNVNIDSEITGQLNEKSGILPWMKATK